MGVHPQDETASQKELACKGTKISRHGNSIPRLDTQEAMLIEEE
jgi:hypothetical protein